MEDIRIRKTTWEGEITFAQSYIEDGKKLTYVAFNPKCCATVNAEDFELIEQ